MKSHCFCVPHDGADVLAETICLNEKSLDAFTMTFIGDAELFHLMKTENKITAHTVNAELSYHILYYLKDAGHPLYKRITIPNLEDFTRRINSLSEKALDNVIIGSDAISQVMEMGMKNQESGNSGLFNTYGDSSSNKERLKKIAHMTSKGTSQDEEISAPSTTTESTTSTQSTSIDQNGPEQITMGGRMLNEFEQNHVIMGGTFPFEFTLGVPSKFSRGHLPHHIFQRLLKAYTRNFENCHNFIFLSFNQVQRHAASSAVSYKAKASDSHLNKLASVLKSSDFDRKLKIALVSPYGKESKELLRIMIPLLRTTGKTIPWGPLERNNELSVLYGMQQRYGPHSLFITFSQMNATQPLVIRLGSRKFKSLENDDSHPGEVEKGEVIWNSDDCSNFRTATARNSPATCAAYFDMVCKAVLKYLFGVQLDAKKEVLIDEMIAGILGSALKARAAHGVPEAQARGALHLHFYFGYFLDHYGLHAL